MPRGDPPDETYITALASYCETFYRAEDAQIDLMRRVRELEDPPSIPEDLKVAGVDTVVQDNTIADECDRVVATIAMRPPTCAVTPPDPLTDSAENNSTDREHFTEQLFEVCGSRIPGRSAFRMLADAMVADGGAVVKWVYDPDRWEPVFQEGVKKEPDEKKRESLKKQKGPPLSRIPVDIRTWYPVFEGDRIVECIEISQRATFPLMRQYGLGYRASGGFFDRMGAPLSIDESQNYPTTVKFLEHWDDTYVTYLAMGGDKAHRLLQIEHGLGRQPYVLGLSLSMNHHGQRKVGRGVGQTKLDLTRQRSFYLSLAVQMAARAAGSPLFNERTEAAEPLQGEDDAPLSTIPMPLSGVIRGAPGEKLSLVPLPGIPDALKDMIGLTQRMIEDTNTPKPNAAIGGDLAGAGYAIQAVLTESKTRFHPIIDALERMYEEETYFVWDLIVNRIQETVWVRRALTQGKPATAGEQWLGCGPDELGGGVGVRWTLDPEPATSKIVEERYVVELMNAGLMSIDQAAAYLGFNPDELRDGKIMDRWRNEAWYTKYIDEQAMKELERGDIMKKAAESVAQSGILPGLDPLQAARLGAMQPMAQPQGAAPGMPIMPDQAALAASPNGQGVAPSGGGPYLPAAGMQAGVQSLGPGG